MTRWFVYEWGKPNSKNPPPSDFQVTTPETPLLSQQTVTSKWISSTLPTYSWTLTPILNWTCSVMTVPLLMHGSQVRDQPIARILVRDFKHQLRRLLTAKFFSSFQTMKIKNMLGHKTQWCTYTATSSQEWWTRARTSSPVTIWLNRVFSMLVQLANLLMALKLILLYV